MAPRILYTDLGYSGKWTYVFAQENGDARVTITEDGEVSNALFRFMSRYVFGLRRRWTLTGLRSRDDSARIRRLNSFRLQLN